MDIKTFTNINIVDVHAKFALEWQPLIEVNILTWAPNTTKRWSLPTMTFFTHSSHLQIAWFMNLWVDLHVGLIFIVFWLQMTKLGGVNVGRNHPWTQNGLLGKLDVHSIQQVFSHSPYFLALQTSFDSKWTMCVVIWKRTGLQWWNSMWWKCKKLHRYKDYLLILECL